MSQYRLAKKRARTRRRAAYIQSTPAFNLIKYQNKIYNRTADFIGSTASYALSLLVEAAFNELYMNSFSNSRLCVHDNYLLESYSRLMKGYNAIIAYYNKHEEGIVDQHSKVILRGIRTIFYTRISEFKDTDVEALGDEKSEYANNYLLQFSREIQELVTLEFPAMLDEVNKAHMGDMWQIDEQKAQDIVDDIKSDIIRHFSEKVYDIYRNCSYRNMSESIKEQARDRINNCFDRIKQEYDILGAVVKIQAPELEARNGEQSVVSKILAMVRAEYENIAGDINHIEALYKQAELGEGEEDNIYTFMNRIGGFINSKDTLKDNKDSFLCEYVFLLDDFDETIKAYILRGFGKRAARFKESLITERDKAGIIATGELSAKVIGEFKRLVDLTEADKAKYEEDFGENQIISGIYETLTIKVQSMGEMLDEYMAEVNEIIYKEVALEDYYGRDKLLASIEKSIEEYKKNNNNYFEDTKESIKFIDSYLKKTLAEIKAKAVQTGFKAVEEERSKAAKQNFRFKKECLFFEIMTFEEIINYSISKLKESENESIVRYALMVELANLNIRKYLIDSGAEIIEPKPHDMFNGKLHEVLMAKEEEGFGKGEIIKVMNNGYREKDIVFARANVICAK
ncbi:nucleotide exchange factor GrpE [Tyzzerella sp. OttesenSCG-928-J15]|nr:nucleotide exchange factor GrpE [Tyzzerella sp. OttesenSCG-928-J15]